MVISCHLKSFFSLWVGLALLFIVCLLSYLSASSLFALPSCLCRPAASQTSRQSSDWCVKRETSSHRSSKEPQSSSISLWLSWKNSVSILTTHNALSEHPTCLSAVCHRICLSLPLYVLYRWGQSEAAAAGARAELGGGAAGCGRQRGDWAEAAADPGPVGGEQSQPGGSLLRAVPPAGAQWTWWVSSHDMTVFCFFFKPWPAQWTHTSALSQKCPLSKSPHTVSTSPTTPTCLVASLQKLEIRCSRAPWLQLLKESCPVSWMFICPQSVQRFLIGSWV